MMDLSISKKRNDRQGELRNFRRVCEAKMLLEWYNGYVEYEPERDEKGKLILDANGRKIHTDKIIEQEIGTIQKLAGRAQTLKKQSNLGERFDGRTFATFDKNREPDAYANASAYAEMDNLFTERGNGRIFIGGTGTGKTHLAASITNVLVGREIPVLFATASEHLTKIKNEFDTPDDGKYLERMKGATMLVIDDLGSELDTEWSQSILYDVVNYRYEHLLPLIITTNLSARDIRDVYGERVYSRLLQMCKVVKMYGTDYRARGN